MNKSLLTLYLQRVKGGDSAYVDKLLAQLAERLLYVPTESDPNETESCVSVRVVRTVEAHRAVVPVFTSKELLDGWAAKNNLTISFISLLGADLSSALRSDSWLCINPDSDTAVELQPFMIERLMRIDEAPEQVVELSTQMVEMPAHVEVIETSAPNSETIIAEIPEPKTPEPAVAEEPAPAPETSPRRKGSFLNFLKSQP